MPNYIAISTASYTRGSRTLWNASASGTGGTGEHTILGAGGVWLPLPTLVKTLHFYVPTGIPVGGTYFYRVRVSTSGTPVMPIASFSYPTNYHYYDLNYTFPQINVTSGTTIDSTVHYLTSWISGGTGSPNIFLKNQYEVPGYPRLSWCVGGSTFGSISISSSDNYVYMTSIQDDTNQSAVQNAWSSTGTIQYFCVAGTIATGTTVEFALQKKTPAHPADFGGGVDTAFSYVLVGAGGSTRIGIHDTTTSVPVTAGDLLNIRLRRIAGTATTATLQWTFGFTSA